MKVIHHASLSVGLLLILAAAAPAVPVIALSTRDQLVSFDSATPGTLSSAVFISGLSANESLVGIDYRPATGELYGLGSQARLYKLNATTGAATFVAGLTTAGGSPLALNGVEFGVDFNPVPDRLRVTSNLGQNLRIDVTTGVTTVDLSLNGVGTHVVSSAYTNSFAGATSTTLYNIESALDILTIQNPPNNGTQVSVGSLGLDVTALAGFDILTVGSTNTAYAALQPAGSQGSRFYTIDLTTGAATLVGGIGANQSSDSLAIRDIAVTPVPEPTVMVSLGLGAMALLRRRRR